MSLMARRASVLLLLRAATSASGVAVPSGAAVEAGTIARAIFDLATPPQVVVFATGGGIQLASHLLGTAGASRCVLDVQMPYSRASLVQILGSEPKKYCAPEVARDLAAAAFERSRDLTRRARDLGDEVTAPAIGVGCTAALRSEPMKRGAHRCYVAVRTEQGTHELAPTLAKGARSRLLEDAVVSRVALVALARASGVPLSAQQDEAWRLAADMDESAHRSRVDDERLITKFVPMGGS